MADNNTLRKDLGPVTAYAIAVEAGFEGTQEEWVRRISSSVDQQSFDTLAASVASGDAALSDKIDTDIGTEAAARSAADTAEAEARRAADTAEATARETADTAQSGRIDTLSETVAGNDATLRNILVHKPADSYSPDGSNGQVLMTHGDGTTEWSSFGQPTPEQAAAAVSAWLDAHPEATTTVVDGSITKAKLDSELKDRVNLATNSLAPIFQQATANDPGTYVSIADRLYYLPEGHTADVTWENTTKVEVQTTSEIKNLSDDVTGLKSALIETDNRLNLVTEQLNNLAPITSNESTNIGVARTYNNGRITLSGTATGSGGRNAAIVSFVLPAGSYRIRLFDIQGQAPSYWSLQKGTTVLAENFTSAKGFTLSEESTLHIGVNVTSGTTYNTTANLMIITGISGPDEYEPPVLSAIDLVARDNDENIETQIESLDDKIETQIESLDEGIIGLSVTLQNGAIYNDATTEIGIRFDSNVIYYIYSIEPVTFNKGDILHIGSGWRVLIFYRRSNGKYEATGGWHTSDFAFDADAVCYIEIGENPLDQTKRISVDEAKVNVRQESRIQKQINAVTADIEDLQSQISHISSGSGGVKLVLSGNGFSVSSIFNGAELTITGNVTQTDVENPCFDLQAYSGSFVKNADDDICPINYGSSYRCAGHGNYVAFNLTATAHGLSESDIGKTYTLDNVTWLLMKVPDVNHVWVVSVPASQTGSFNTSIASSGTLVGTSGNIAFTAKEQTQIRPQNINRKYLILADGKEITQDGTYYCEKLDLTETYQSSNTYEMVQYLIANVGSNTNSSYYNNSIPGEVQYDVTYSFYGNGSCCVSHKDTILRDGIVFSFDGLTQVQRYGTHPSAYVPFTDIGYPYELPESDLNLSKSHWNDANFPPYKYYEFDPITGLGFGVAYDITFGMGIPEIRKGIITTSDGAGFYHYPGWKMYPKFYNKGATLTKGTVIAGNVCRIPVKKIGNYVAYWWKTNSATFVEIETFGECMVEVELPSDAVGKNATLVKASETIPFDDTVIASTFMTVYASGVGSATIKLT